MLKKNKCIDPLEEFHDRIFSKKEEMPIYYKRTQQTDEIDPLADDLLSKKARFTPDQIEKLKKGLNITYKKNKEQIVETNKTENIETEGLDELDIID